MSEDFYAYVRGRTDVVIVTDCQARIPAGAAARFRAWKSDVKARVVTLALGGGPGELSSISDEAHTVADLTADSEAAARVLSV